jgi:DNA polymerase-1
MGMDAVCPSCGHAERSNNHRGARLGDCPKCGTPMRGHTAGRAKGRYICPVNGGVITLGLRYTVQLTEPMRLAFVPGWDDDRREPDPDRPGWLRPVTYHRTEPTGREQEQLDRAGGRVFGPGCVLSGGFEPDGPGGRYHGKAGVYLLPASDTGPADWFVNEPVKYKKCAACPKRVVASDKTRIDHEWIPARENYWRGQRSVNVSRGPHPAGSYACPDCRPPGGNQARQPRQAAAEVANAATIPQEDTVTPGPAVAGPVRGSTRTTATDQRLPAGNPAGEHAAIHDAVARLAGVCDFAESQDGQGFNATDTWLGHALAAMPATEWTADQALAAWDMLRKYGSQLDGFGMPHASLPRPHGAGELEEERRAEARERARQGARRWRGQQYRKARSYVRCDGEGEQVTLAFPYDPDLVSQAKAIKGRSFDWDTKDNVYPFTSLPQVVALAETHGIDVAAEVRALVPVAAAAGQQEAARPDVYTDPAGRVVIKAEYDRRLNEALKELNGGRSTWDRGARVHVPPVHRDPGRVLAIAEEFGLAVGEDARAAITGEQGRQDRNEAAGTAFEADPVPIPGLADGLSLKPQQYPVVRFAAEHRRVLIGDGMGWGKTLSSLAAVAADSAYPAVVVCRPSLTLNWAAEIRRFFPALAVHEASGTTPQPIPAGTDVIVIGSAALAAKPQKTRTGGKEFGWVTALAAAGPKALIIDEGQDTKERAANRSQACEQLAASVTGRDGLVLDLTGTAILNRPRELCQQLSILGRIGEFGGPKAFMWRYCLAEVNEWGASYDGARNLIELHDRLLRWGIMIRRADDAKLGLPPCREHVLRIPQAELDPAVMARYRRAEADLLAFLAGQARQAAEQLGQDPTSAAVQATVRASAAEHLVAINALRQLAGQAKRGYVTTWIGERVAAGEKVMVAAHHRGEVDAYAAAFGGLKLQGGQSVAEKEAAKAAFQNQPAGQAPVIAVAIGAGGVGHTLTAAATGIQAEQAWTPGETQQMKKRLHRIGQDRPVDYYITVAEHTIDEHLWDVVTSKQATLDAVLDGKTDHGADTDDKSIAAELAWRLTQQGLGQAAGRDSVQGTDGGEHNRRPATSARAGLPERVTRGEEPGWVTGSERVGTAKAGLPLGRSRPPEFTAAPRIRAAAAGLPQTRSAAADDLVRYYGSITGMRGQYQCAGECACPDCKAIRERYLSDSDGGDYAPDVRWELRDPLTGTVLSHVHPDSFTRITPGDGGPAVSTQRGHDQAGQVTDQPADQDGGSSADERGAVSSVLDEAALARMRAEAASEASPFTDPALLRKAEALLAAADHGWLDRVVGHPVPSYRSLSQADLLAAVRAAEVDAAHLEALAAARRAGARRARQRQAETAAQAARAGHDRWRALRSRLPVPVTVQHNWTARHLDGYVQGGNHIVAGEDLNVGRFRRAAGMALCWTPSRARELRHVSGNAGDENRLPDCKTCLRHAEKLAAGNAPASDASPQAAGMKAHQDETDTSRATPPAATQPQRLPVPQPDRTGATAHSGDDDEAAGGAGVTRYVRTCAGHTMTVYAPQPGELDQDAFTAFAAAQTVLGLDVETSALRDDGPRHFGPGFTVRLVQFGSEDEAWVLNLADPAQRAAAAKVLADPARRFVTHTPYDVLAVWSVLGIPLGQRVIDTHLLSKLVNPDERAGHGLKQLAGRHLDDGLANAEEALHARMWAAAPASQRTGGALLRWGWNHLPADDEDYVVYAGLDAIYARRLLPVLTGQCAPFAHLIRAESWLAAQATGITIRGLQLDQPYTRALLATLEAEHQAAEAVITARLGCPGASPRFAAWLDEQTRWCGITGLPRTDTGQLQVTEATLTALLEEHRGALPPLVTDLARQRLVMSKTANLIANLRGFLTAADPDGRVHPQVNTLRAKTARMSVTAPALQTLKKHDPRLRRCFRGDDGQVLISCDFSQVEIRVAAALSRDPALLQAIGSGTDIHDATAALIYGPGFTAEQRTIAKRATFGAIYGGGARALAAQTGASEDAAREVISRWKNAYPGVAAYGRRMAELPEITTASGRRIPADPGRPYASANYAIQSTARDLLVAAIYTLVTRHKVGGLWLFVHDEIIVQAPERDAERVRGLLQQAMTGTFRGVPVLAEATILGPTWGRLDTPADPSPEHRARTGQEPSAAHEQHGGPEPQTALFDVEPLRDSTAVTGLPAGTFDPAAVDRTLTADGYHWLDALLPAPQAPTCETCGQAMRLPAAAPILWTCTACHPGEAGSAGPFPQAPSGTPPGTANGARKTDAGDDADFQPRRAAEDNDTAQLRALAHDYLGQGLLPVPAWAVRQNGECCCRRGGDCPRPGKHPRSVHTGPGPADYSWKPLACHTHQDVDTRFADGGPYAGANLMLAIPAGMMVIDQDNDDGGHQAITRLAADLGELPATLTHHTPHGQHHIYRTPPGWIGRAWVGKDPRNPLPAGIDLRMPGQILMAPPSQVPGPTGPLEYGPPSGGTVTDLPAAYLTAWTPPRPQARPADPVPVTPAAADRAASYVHKKITGVVADLASHEAGGRNTAIYTAALKVGSVLGAARTTPGAEHAASGWPDEAAEQALMNAAVQNGYAGKHGATLARSTIRSGLRNGLRNPRALPDFSGPARHPPKARVVSTRRDTQREAEQAASTAGPPDTAAQPDPAGQASSPRTPPARPSALSARGVSAVLDTGGYPAFRHDARTGHTLEGYQVQARPSHGDILIRHVAVEEDIGSAAPAQRTAQMLDRYAHTLQKVGLNVAITAAGTLAIATQPASAATSEPPRMRANHAALAANHAYRTGDLDQARQHIDRAAALDPSRNDLWQRHREEITARQLFLDAQTARDTGDHDHAQQLLQQAQELDPRMRTLWKGHLHLEHEHAPPRVTRSPDQGADLPAHGAGPNARPRWPDRPALTATAQAADPAQVASKSRDQPRDRSVAADASQTSHRALQPGTQTGHLDIHRAHTGLQHDDHAAEQHPAQRGGSKAASPARESTALPSQQREPSQRPAASPHRPVAQPDGGASAPSHQREGRKPAKQARQTEAADWRDTIISNERNTWQPRPIQLDGMPLRAPQADGPEVTG